MSIVEVWWRDWTSLCKTWHSWNGLKRMSHTTICIVQKDNLIPMFLQMASTYASANTSKQTWSNRQARITPSISKTLRAKTFQWLSQFARTSPITKDFITSTCTMCSYLCAHKLCSKSFGTRSWRCTSYHTQRKWSAASILYWLSTS